MGMAVEVRRRRFTADEYQQMAKLGILREGDPFELIDGEVVAKMTIGPGTTPPSIASTALRVAVPASAIVQAARRGPARTSSTSPSPIWRCCAAARDFYAVGVTQDRDILLVVEVAQSSIDYDRTVKAELYARLGVAEYRLVDLNADVVTRHTEPADGQYRRVEPVPAGDSFAPAVAGVRLTTADIFG